LSELFENIFKSEKESVDKVPDYGELINPHHSSDWLHFHKNGTLPTRPIKGTTERPQEKILSNAEIFKPVDMKIELPFGIKLAHLWMHSNITSNLLSNVRRGE